MKQVKHRPRPVHNVASGLTLQTSTQAHNYPTEGNEYHLHVAIIDEET